MAQMLGHYRDVFPQRIEKQDEEKREEEENEFLKVREKRKEMYRQKLKKQNAKIFGHSIQPQDGQSTSKNTKFGSFFGPSKPAIASRVLDEFRSIRDISTPPSSSRNQRVSAFASERKLSEQHQPLKINEVKRKAQTLKDMRDYSFLHSDDADLPDNKESQAASRHVSASKPEARSAQKELKSKIPISGSLKSASNGHNMKNGVQTARPMQTKLIPESKKPISSRNIRDDSLKKQPLRRRSDEGEDANAIQMIRNMFSYNPSKYADEDDDDRDMEADFSQIEREEWRSCQIARKEDEEQLRLIEEEERRERLRKKRKSNMR